MENLIIPDGITKIGRYSFWDYDVLESVVIPASINKIEIGAFDYCDNIASIYITDVAAWCNISFDSFLLNRFANDLYLNGELVKDIVIPEGVIAIPPQAFCGTSIESVVIYEGVISIGHSAFENCNNLKEVTIPSSVSDIGYNAFLNTSISRTYIFDMAAWCNISFSNEDASPLCHINNASDLYLNGQLVKDIVIPDGVSMIPAYAFNCKSIETIVIPDSVKNISKSSFRYCENLKSVTIGMGVSNIDEQAFYNCWTLQDVHIADIGSWCSISFADSLANPLCHAENLYLNGELVTELVIPEGTTEIKDYSFYMCDSIQSVVIPDSVTGIGDRAFYECDNLASVVIGNGVINVGEYAFSGCANLTSVVIPNAVASIGNYAFSGCDSLESAVFGDGVKFIGYRAFYDCEELKTVVLGNGVEIVMYDAFGSCDELESVYYTAVPRGWVDIYFASDNEELTEATRYYYYEVEPDFDGNFWYYGEDGDIVVW